jgi:hypothetical protein
MYIIRSFTFLIYTCSQLVLIIVTAYHTARGTHVKKALPIVPRISYNSTNLSYIIRTFLYSIALVAIASSLFTSAGGTALQIVGVNRNCLCSIPVSTWLTTRSSEKLNIASDTAEERAASKYWSACGFTAIGFLAFACYLGWWYQRHLRKRLEQRIENLIEYHTRRSKYYVGFPHLHLQSFPALGNDREIRLPIESVA